MSLKGNKSNLGNFRKEDAEPLDYYATSPIASEKFIKSIKEFNIDIGNKIWECCVGEGNIKKVFEDYNYQVVGTDIIERNYPIDNKFNFLELDKNPYPNYTILTNPPFKNSLLFVKKAINLIQDGEYAVFFLKIQFLESKARYEFFKENPPKYVLIHSSRVRCYKNNDIEKFSKGNIACYCWYIWEKGYKGDPIIKFIE